MTDRELEIRGYFWDVNLGLCIVVAILWLAFPKDSGLLIALSILIGNGMLAGRWRR